MTLPGPTERLRFRRFVADDAPRVLEMFSDAEAARFYPRMGDPVAAERWIAWNMDNYATHGFGLWVIEARKSGEFLGDCGLTMQPVEGVQMLEVGYHLVERHRGSGYATEAASACRDHALGALGSATVCSIVDPQNDASRAVAQRVHQNSRRFTNEVGRPMVLFWTTAPSAA